MFKKLFGRKKKDDEDESKKVSDKKTKKNTSGDQKAKKTEKPVKKSPKKETSSSPVEKKKKEKKNKEAPAPEKKTKEAPAPKKKTKEAPVPEKKTKEAPAPVEKKKEKKTKETSAPEKKTKEAPAPVEKKKKEKGKEKEKTKEKQDEEKASKKTMSTTTEGSVTRTSSVVPNKFHKFVVGKGGARIKEIKEQSGATDIILPGADSKSDEITIIAPNESAAKAAEKELRKVVKEVEADEKKNDDLYNNQRKAIDEHAKKRDQYYQESKEAYERGDKALAKELSEKGKEEGKKMEKAKQKASEKIFNAKNDNNPWRIDLHGLNVDEAMTMVEKRLEKLKNDGEKGELSVITGAGNHSGPDGPRIKPTVEEYLKKNKYSYHPEKNGTYVVTIA